MFPFLLIDTLLGVGGDPKAPGFEFRYDTDEPLSNPNSTGLKRAGWRAVVRRICGTYGLPRRHCVIESMVNHSRSLEGQSPVHSTAQFHNKRFVSSHIPIKKASFY
jgi:hypothetical protein